MGHRSFRFLPAGDWRAWLAVTLLLTLIAAAACRSKQGSVGQAVPTPAAGLSAERVALTVSILPEGAGSVELAPASEDNRYALGSSVLVKANCSSGAVIWAGDVPEKVWAASNPLLVTLDRDRTLVAVCSGGPISPALATTQEQPAGGAAASPTATTITTPPEKPAETLPAASSPTTIVTPKDTPSKLRVVFYLRDLYDSGEVYLTSHVQVTEPVTPNHVQADTTPYVATVHSAQRTGDRPEDGEPFDPILRDGPIILQRWAIRAALKIANSDPNAAITTKLYVRARRQDGSDYGVRTAEVAIEAGQVNEYAFAWGDLPVESMNPTVEFFVWADQPGLVLKSVRMWSAPGVAGERGDFGAFLSLDMPGRVTVSWKQHYVGQDAPSRSPQVILLLNADYGGELAQSVHQRPNVRMPAVTFLNASFPRNALAEYFATAGSGPSLITITSVIVNWLYEE
ncbi:MAG: hypothetical protein HYY31_03455 [Chloroflexi bacterium]|nr:hypothetical protein [Chloroflexota bacterium]